MQDFPLQTLGMVHLDATVRPLDDLRVVVGEHLGQLVQEFRHGLRLGAVFLLAAGGGGTTTTVRDADASAMVVFGATVGVGDDLLSGGQARLTAVLFFHDVVRLGGSTLFFVLFGLFLEACSSLLGFAANEQGRVVCVPP